MAKDEITSLCLKGDNDVIIIDPEREYSQLVTALGGEVVTISAASNNHINALDIGHGMGILIGLNGVLVLYLGVQISVAILRTTHFQSTQLAQME